MNCLFILCVLFSVCAAAVLPEDSEATIIKYQSSNDGTGNYNFSYETSNGIVREETGHLVNSGQEDQYMSVKGSYTYRDLEGKVVVVEYTADENGYHTNIPLTKSSSGIPTSIWTTLGK